MSTSRFLQVAYFDSTPRLQMLAQFYSLSVLPLCVSVTVSSVFPFVSPFCPPLSLVPWPENVPLKPARDMVYSDHY